MITFSGGVCGWYWNGGSGGMEELSQRLLKDSDTGSEGGKCTAGDQV